MMDCPLKLFLMSFPWNEVYHLETRQDWGNNHEGHDINTFCKYEIGNTK